MQIFIQIGWDTHIENGHFVFRKKSRSFLEYHETCGGAGRNFVLGVSKDLPIYLALAQSFDFSLQIFEFRQKMVFLGSDY